jgi:hypothetical protein
MFSRNEAPKMAFESLYPPGLAVVFRPDINFSIRETKLSKYHLNC